MRTENIITMLANDSEIAVKRPDFSHLAGVGLACALAFVLALEGLTGMGIRADYGEAIRGIGAVVKQVMPLVLALLLLPVLVRAYRPDTDLRGGLLRALPYVLIMGFGFVIAWFATPTDEIMHSIAHPARIKCVTMVPLFSIPAYIGLAYVLRCGAPSEPIRTGFWAGLAAGGLGCFAYAFGCDMDSPLYFVIWYSAGILMTGVLGALIGAWVLRW